MLYNAYMRTLYSNCSYKNQAEFICDFIVAASKESKKLQTQLDNYSDNNRKNLFGKLNKEIKAVLNSSFDEDGVTSFLNSKFSQTSFINLLDEFRIPKNTSREAAFLAMARQFKEFVASPNVDVVNVMTSFYDNSHDEGDGFVGEETADKSESVALFDKQSGESSKTTIVPKHDIYAIIKASKNLEALRKRLFELNDTLAEKELRVAFEFLSMANTVELSRLCAEFIQAKRVQGNSFDLAIKALAHRNQDELFSILQILFNENRQVFMRYFVDEGLLTDQRLVEQFIKESLGGDSFDAESPIISVYLGNTIIRKVKLLGSTPLMVGRNKRSCDIVYENDVRVSSIHCHVSFDERKKVFYLIDISTNGTYLDDDIRLDFKKKYTLQAGTRFYIASRDNALSVDFSESDDAQPMQATESYPDMLTFFEMFDIANATELNILERWKTNNPSVSLRTPIGVDGFGEVIELDLHENFHGSHGLVSGMTGSGKSEFLLTFILSLSSNYSPDDVSFLLLDYKGGGFVSVFTNYGTGINLPHIAGAVTSLDYSALNRMMISLQSEVKRRQMLLSEARRFINEPALDIYKYQKAFRDGSVSEPMPHLFIITDEFAELKIEHPEIMSFLVTIARVGRTLGIHLILGTQKASGVVDDQIWSNSKFRVALRMVSEMDSREMLKIPDAAYLTVAGRFILQVGFNEVLLTGQSAWSGAIIADENSLTNSLFSLKKRQIEEVVKYIYEVCLESGVQTKPLWIAPLPDKICYSEIKIMQSNSKASHLINPVIGLFDDPENMSQSPLTLDFCGKGNAVIFGSHGSGKTTFLTTLIYSLITKNTANQINIYILDFEGGILREYAEAPQIGAVILSHESERVASLFKMVSFEFENRRKLFANFGGDFCEYNAANGDAISAVLIIIDNYAAFSERYEEQDEIVRSLTRDGQRYGIYFVITSNSVSGVRYRLLQNFNQQFALHLNTTDEYMDIVGKTNGLYPRPTSGRGLFRDNGLYEFQTAVLASDSNQVGIIREVVFKQKLEAVYHAPHVPTMPEQISSADVSAEYRGLIQVPIGIDKNTLNIFSVNLKDCCVFPVLSWETATLQFFAAGLAEIISSNGTNVTMLDAEALFEEYNRYHITYIAFDFEKAVQKLSNEIIERQDTYVQAMRKGIEKPVFQEKVYFIFGLKKLFDFLDENGNSRLRSALGMIEKELNVLFVVFDTPRSVMNYSFDDWYRRQVSGADGLWIGEGLISQNCLKPSSKPPSEVEDGYGVILRKGKTTLVKLLSGKPYESLGAITEFPPRSNSIGAASFMPMSFMTEISVGNILDDKYTILSVLGRGGYGKVFKAVQKGTDRPVAIKLIANDDMPSENREVDVLKNLNHPFLPQVVDVFSYNDNNYLAMEYIEGQTLTRLTNERNPLDVELAVNIIIKLCEVVDYLHCQSNQVIHGDINPNNIMVRPDNNVCLIDFNTSLIGNDNSKSLPMGITRGYSAPELYSEHEKKAGGSSPYEIGVTCIISYSETSDFTDEAPRELTKLSDIYSIGATLYFALSNNRPSDVFDANPPKLDVDKKLWGIIQKCMHIEPSKRYQTAKNVKEDLCNYIRSKKGMVN